jgi:hypothetical protein
MLQPDWAGVRPIRVGRSPVWPALRTALAMGTTFVTLAREISGNEPGFWMRDGMLELWLRLLALHLPEPTNSGEHQATLNIRNQWLLASRGYFGGCVPHGMENACATQAGRDVVRIAIDSLLAALERATTPLDSDTLDLLGVEGVRFAPIERKRLQEIGHAFLDLLDGQITCTASSTDVMPGSKPYISRTENAARDGGAFRVRRRNELPPLLM